MSRAFTDVSFHELPRGQGRQTKEPPVEAVRDSAHIKCTETHADNEILSKESSCLKIYPFYEQQLCNFLKKLKSLNPEHNILLIFQGQREMQALHPIQGRRWWVGIPVRSWNLAQCQGACLAHTWLQQTFHFFIFYFFFGQIFGFLTSHVRDWRWLDLIQFSFIGGVINEGFALVNPKEDRSILVHSGERWLLKCLNIKLEGGAGSSSIRRSCKAHCMWQGEVSPKICRSLIICF